jgi:hypothetical protein
MDRREAIKSLGFGSMAVISSSTLLGALHASAGTRSLDGPTSFFDENETAQLEKICEGILPRTQTPGATDAGVARHLDKALASVYRHREAEYIRQGLGVFVRQFDATGVSFKAANTNQITDRINDYLKRFNADPDMLTGIRQSAKEDNAKSEEFLENYFVANVVEATIWSYFTSELVGENVMRYDPIPGKYEACIPYRKGEKSWSSV